MKGQLVKELSNADRAADNGRIWAWREDNNSFWVVPWLFSRADIVK